MKPEQWQQAREVLADALELKPEERPAFLDRVCSSDNSLRREVERLLSSSGEAQSSFLQSSALRVTLMPGAKLGDYEVKGLLGSGGMGEVYRARDTRLGRDVAIKVLPSFLSQDPDRLRRFEQEARAAAALNHPNILAVFQMGTYEGAPYLVSELLEGGTLREQLVRGPMPLRKAIDCAVQIARGLAAAHEKGIVHRDLKPENLFVTKDGRVKILDFGLAKLVQRPTTLDHSTVTASNGTEPGVVMGTVGYMSPEQVCGKGADHRADIFAFGAILYEMLSGKRAFQKPTSAETMSAILNEDPPGISQIVPNLPPGLQRVAHRCLEKNPEQRFQSASDLAFALEALSDAGGYSGGKTTVAPRVRSASSRRYAAAVVVVVVMTVVAAAIYFSRGRSRPMPEQSQWTQLTDFADSVVSPAVSADGRMVAFIRGASTGYGPGEVYVKMLPSGEPVELTHDGQVKLDPQFSPDGSRIAYGVIGNWDSWLVPVLGGEPRLMLPNATGLTWIDDHHVLFSEIKSGLHMAVVKSDESRADSRDVYVPARESGMAHRSALSPDRKQVLVAEMDNSLWLPCRLVPFDGSSPGRQVGPPGAACYNVAWSPDGKWMYFVSNAGGRHHIWRQASPDDTPQQVTSSASEEEDGIALAPDGRSLITSVGAVESTLWVNDNGKERQLSSQGLAYDPQFSPDGKQIYYRVRHAQPNFGTDDPGELQVVDVDSAQTRGLLPDFSINRFSLSPDGKRIVFSATDKHDHSRVWVASLDLRFSPRQFSSAVDEDQPVFASDGQVFFRAAEGGSNFLYRMKEDGSGRTKVLPEAIYGFLGISPDRQWVIARLASKGEETPYVTEAFPLAGGAPVRICVVNCTARWAPGGKALVLMFSNMGSTQSFLVPIAPGKSLPALPAGGVKSKAEAASLKGAILIPAEMNPGAQPGVYAFRRISVHRNLYRIPLP